MPSRDMSPRAFSQQPAPPKMSFNDGVGPSPQHNSNSRRRGGGQIQMNDNSRSQWPRNFNPHENMQYNDYQDDYADSGDRRPQQNFDRKRGRAPQDSEDNFQKSPKDLRYQLASLKRGGGNANKRNFSNNENEQEDFYGGDGFEKPKLKSEARKLGIPLKKKVSVSDFTAIGKSGRKLKPAGKTDTATGNNPLMGGCSIQNLKNSMSRIIKKKDILGNTKADLSDNNLENVKKPAKSGKILTSASGQRKSGVNPTEKKS